MSPEEAKELLTGDFGKQLLGDLINVAAAIAWGYHENGEWTLLSNGSAFVLDCGERTVVVTCAHVYEGFVADLGQRSDLHCQLGSMHFNLCDRLICTLGSSTLDIATFHIEKTEIATLGKRVCVLDPRSSRPKVGNGLLLSGWPGVERTKRDAQAFNFGLYTALTPISSVSERHIGCAYERDFWIDTLQKGIPAEGYNMGGVSGGPAFTIHETPEKIITWSLAGVIYNATAGLGEIVLSHHIDFILPDGKLRAPN